MKGNFLKSALLASILFSIAPQLIAAPETYNIDPNHTYVEWHIDHFGYSHPTGKWMANGTLTFDAENQQNSKVDIKINVADMITGLPELDKHLKSDVFFDAKKFPTATFVSDKVVLKNNKISKVQGNLTVHGVTKPVTLNVKLNKNETSPLTQKPTIGFTADTKVKRSDFGITSFSPGLGDDVTLNIEVEAFQDVKK